MDICVGSILESTARCSKNSKKFKDNDRALLYRRINGSVLCFLSDTGDDSKKLSPAEKMQSVVGTVMQSIEQLVCDFLWFTRCCSNATEIADTFNSMHLAGLVVCKSFFILCKYSCNRHANTADANSGAQKRASAQQHMNLNNLTIPSLFPDYPTIHVSRKQISILSYSELVYVLTSLQEHWHVLIVLDADAAAKTIVACMVRFCIMYCLQLPATELDDIQEREPIPSQPGRGELFVMSKRATRHFLTTFVCMLRELVICQSSCRIAVQQMTTEQRKTFVVNEVLSFGQTLPVDISRQIQTCFSKIKCIRNAAAAAATPEELSADALPAPPSKEAPLPPHAVQGAPHV